MTLLAVISMAVIASQAVWRLFLKPFQPSEDAIWSACLLTKWRVSADATWVGCP
jgi:hypothetical protein